MIVVSTLMILICALSGCDELLTKHKIEHVKISGAHKWERGEYRFCGFDPKSNSLTCVGQGDEMIDVVFTGDLSIANWLCKRYLDEVDCVVDTETEEAVQKAKLAAESERAKPGQQGTDNKTGCRVWYDGQSWHWVDPECPKRADTWR
jgi:hypothetical protein